jgi:hypothetical protein
MSQHVTAAIIIKVIKALYRHSKYQRIATELMHVLDEPQELIEELTRVLLKNELITLVNSGAGINGKSVMWRLTQAGRNAAKRYL